jgi:5'-AMP-activated protein kinase regulatory beta subunit
VPGTAKQSPPHAQRQQDVASHAIPGVNSSGYQLDLSEDSVMQELNARHSASVAAKLDALKQQQQQQQHAQGQNHGTAPWGQQQQGSRQLPGRSLSPGSDFWRQSQQDKQRPASQGLQEVLVYSGHYACELPAVPGGVRQDGYKKPAPMSVQHNYHITSQSPHGSLAKGLAGLAVSGGRSEFPVVPLEATLVKALLGWAAGTAQSVEVKGSYDGWGPARRLQKQPDGSWSIAAYLSPGVYQYKYVVDGVWRFNPSSPVVRDEDGNLNNVLEVVDPCTSFDIPVDFDPPPSPPSSYGQHLPSSGDLATEPPLLPPQANLTPLDLGLSPSDPWPEAGEPQATHPAEHSVLNHIYIARSSHRSSAPESQLPREPLVMGATIRYRGKHVATVMYKPRPREDVGLASSGRMDSGVLADVNR